MAEQYTVNKVADILGVSRQRVHQLIKAKRLKAKRVGHIWLIADADLGHYMMGKVPVHFFGSTK